MASLGGLTTSVLHHRCHRRRWRLTSASRFLGDPACFVNSISLSTLCSSSNFPTLSSTHRAHLFHSPLGFPSKPYLKTRCCRVGCPSPPAAVPQPDPPPVKNQQPFAGIGATFSRFQEKVWIFLAVLFWMSLFFWASASNDRDNGRRNTGNRFRR